MISNRGKYSFPWRQGNEFRLLIDGTHFYRAVLEAIGRARRYIFMEMYLVESGQTTSRFVQAFSEASRRGVTVLLLLDDFGSRGLSKEDRVRLSAAGVRLSFYNPLRYAGWIRNLLRTHRKLLIVDGELAYIGSAGIADEFDGSNGWRETAVEVSGPVVSDWEILFARNWEHWSELPVPSLITTVASQGGQRGKVTCTHGPIHQEIKRSVLVRIRHARARIWMASAYFVPSHKLRRALRRAALRGVDVRLLLPGPVTDHPAVRYASQRFYARLLRHGVRIFEYQQRFMHSKVIIADHWCSIGSSNGDRWNLRWNLEANQEIEDRSLSEEVRFMLETDFQQCKEICYQDWKRRSVMQRIKETLWGWVDRRLAQWRPSKLWHGKGDT